MKKNYASIQDSYDKEVGRCMALIGGRKGMGTVYDRVAYLPGNEDSREDAINSCLNSASSMQRLSVIAVMTENGKIAENFYRCRDCGVMLEDIEYQYHVEYDHIGD